MTSSDSRSRRLSTGLTAVAAGLLGACLLLGLPAQAQTKAASKPKAQTKPLAATRPEPVTLNFVNAEIEAVARTIGSITGINVVVDPRVKGTMTLITDKPVSRMAAVNQFMAALRLQGFTMVESANLYKVVPEADAKLQTATVTLNEAGPGGAVGNQVVTQIFSLNYESANNLVPVLRPLISANNTINVNPGNNSLVITDYADNLRRIGRIIAAMDVANATDVEVLPLKHAIASDLAPLVLRLIESAAGPAAATQADTSFKTTVVAEPRSNSLILRAANGARMALVKSLVSKLDQPDTGANQDPAGNIHVVYLKNADATKLAATLRAAISGEVRAASSAAPGAAPAGSAPAATSGGQVQADAATNSLIITAPEPQYRQLRAVIDRLDARRAQVFVESLIAEVSADRAAEFGIQWQGALGAAGNANIGLLGTNFGKSISNIINLSTAAAAGAPAVARGVNYLKATQEGDGLWSQPHYTGGGFPLQERMISARALLSVQSSLEFSHFTSSPMMSNNRSRSVSTMISTSFGSGPAGGLLLAGTPPATALSNTAFRASHAFRCAASAFSAALR
ncbi:MAG: hypothetical protein NTY26_15770, partial [Burkholderiales bacterium]|nr:hypothetical protein [Burkholderiales bacterium]